LGQAALEDGRERQSLRSASGRLTAQKPGLKVGQRTRPPLLMTRLFRSA